MRRNKENATWIDVTFCLFKGASYLIGALVIIMFSALVLLVLL
ncbi:hypothetical protein [Providencia rettgeri]|nr:hypothetical protein [Providencia rettgeri]